MNKSARLCTPSRAGFLIIAAVLAACASTTDGGSAPSDVTSVPAAPGAPAPPVTKDVGSGGGTVVNASGTGVEVPPGALPANVQISVTSAPDKAPPSGASSLGTPTVFGPNGVQFAKPVTVVIAFDPAKLPAGTNAANIVVYTAPDGTTDYQPLSTVVRDATHVAAETTHFCVLVPVIPPPDDSSTAPDASTTDPGAGAADGGGPTQTGGGSADASAPNAGSDGGTCQPVLCGAYGPGACGTLADQCGGKLDCGVCTGGGGAADGGATAPDSGTGTCMPLSCPQYQGKCGTLPDGCGGNLDCNTNCASDGGAGTGATDAGAPPPPPSDGGFCKSCQPGMCGTFPDGCGNMLDCGACDGGGGGAADAGPCVPMICKPGMCGVLPDGCGGSLDCTATCVP